MADDGSRDPTGSFIRWQAYCIAQLTTATNLVLTLSLAVLGFLLILMVKPDEYLQPNSTPARLGLVVSTISIGLSVAFGVWLSLNRMASFRATAQVARMREKNRPDSEMAAQRARYEVLDARTWCLFNAQVWTFGAGIAFAFASIVFPAACRFLLDASV